MNEKLRRKEMRRRISSYCWALLIYYVLMNIMVGAAAAVEMMAQLVTAPGQELSAEEITGSWGYLITSVMGVVLIRLWKRKDFFRGMWKTERDMTPGAFWGILCIFVGGQTLFQLVAMFQEWVLNLFGLSVLEPMMMATVSSETFGMFLYMGLFAPIVEEIIFRGMVLRGLAPYGKRFAVLGSAILFGLFHGNLVQSPYAFAVGLVLGYTALEYNIVWAMVLHMVNNLILGDTLNRLTMWMGTIGSSFAVQAVILVCTVIGIAVLLRKRKSIGEYLRQEPFDWDAWKAFCSAPGLIVLFLLMELKAFSMILL